MPVTKKMERKIKEKRGRRRETFFDGEVLGFLEKIKEF